MSDFEEQTINTLKNLFERVDTLRRINIRDILKPDIYQLYEDTLQEAYDAMTTVEDALTALGMKLEYQHFRLGGTVDELRPLMIQPRSNIDRVMEAMHETPGYTIGQRIMYPPMSNYNFTSITPLFLFVQVKNEKRR